MAENQPQVRVKVLQGEAQQADACIRIGECWIEGLPPNLPKGSPVQVRCGVGSNGLIDVMALDMTSGKMARTVIHRSQRPVGRGDRPRGGVGPRPATFSEGSTP